MRAGKDEPCILHPAATVRDIPLGHAPSDLTPPIRSSPRKVRQDGAIHGKSGTPPGGNAGQQGMIGLSKVCQIFESGSC